MDKSVKVIYSVDEDTRLREMGFTEEQIKMALKQRTLFGIVGKYFLCFPTF